MIKERVKKVIFLLPVPIQKRFYSLAKKSLSCYRILRGPSEYPQNCVSGMLDSKEYASAKELILKELSLVGEYAPYIKDFNAPLPPVATRPNRLPDGVLFVKIMKELGSELPDIVLLCPWLIRGGADLMVLNIANTLSLLGKKVLIITTETKPSDWVSSLSNKVKLIEFGIYAKKFSFDKKKYLLARLLIQLRPEVVHNLQSRLGFETFYAYHKSLKNFTKLYASFYADSLNKDGLRRGFVSRYLQSLSPNLDSIISDQPVNPKEYERMFGIPAERWKVLYGLVESCKRKNISSSQKNGLLWASRFDDSKLPNLLEEIILNFPEIHFHIYGAPYKEELKKKYDRLKKIKNVTLYGAYNSFAQINKEEVFCFLYTSESDGLPNVLLEAAAEGIPIISSSVGGIRSFLNDKNSWLVPTNDISDFTFAIRNAFNNKEESLKKAEQAQLLVMERHSKENFIQSVKNIYKIEST